MQGYLALVLHAHLPFVRHPEHDRFLEESWLFEAVTETYVPLLWLLDGWNRDGLPARLTLSLSPTLAAMLLDPLLRERYARHLDGLIGLAEKERYRTHWDPALRPLAAFYHDRFQRIRQTWLDCEGNLIAAFGRCQERGQIEIITCAATHALLPLLADHPPSVRAQILVARDHHRRCFGSEPRGIWLPECAYADAVEPALREANLRWFILDVHGLLHATPRPRFGVFAPVFTPNGIAAFGRDLESAQQVWSRKAGYPGDPRYRDFYRDIGFDLEWDYVKPYLPAPDQRAFTGIKYHRITGAVGAKEPYDRTAALRAAEAHAAHFLEARQRQFQRVAPTLDRPPLIVSPYDAELFGHWWYEGPEFLDACVRQASSGQHSFAWITPGEYLRRHPTLQVVRPSPSSWGEEGYWRVWLNETNEWIYPHLQMAQEQMTELTRHHPQAQGLPARALKQAARELLLAQASDWPFILRTGTGTPYARKRVTDHLLRFRALHEQVVDNRVDAAWLGRIESQDNLFPDIDPRYWAC
jgi:1,4-alpha-glucan branching enzyme